MLMVRIMPPNTQNNAVPWAPTAGIQMAALSMLMVTTGATAKELTYEEAFLCGGLFPSRIAVVHAAAMPTALHALVHIM